MSDVDNSPMVGDETMTVQEVIRLWLCEKYVYNDKDFGCDADCSRNCPAKDVEESA